MINGQAAEGMIKNIFKDLGLLEPCPVETDKMLSVIKHNMNKHFKRALGSLIEDYGFVEVNSNIFADRCLGCDGFILDPNTDNIVSYDITVNPKTNSINHKYEVQKKVKKVKKELGLTDHIIIFLSTSRNYIELTQEDKWFVEDKVLDAISNNDKEVYIKL